MRFRRMLKAAGTVLCTAVLLASCATNSTVEEPGTIPVVTDEREVDGLFNIKGLDVASYRIRGEGPDGAWFDWVESDTPRIALADVRRGAWTLYAQGLNRYGEPVIQGKLETFLSEDSPIDNLVFDEMYGTGDIRSSIAWNPVQAMHPSIDVYLKADDGEWQPRPSDEITMSDGTAVWTAKDIPSGSYIARFILRDGSTPIAGAGAAVRVIDDSTSIGQVRLTIGDLSHVYGIELQNIPADTVDGRLVLDGRNAVFMNNSKDEGLIYDWFIDGDFQITTEAKSYPLDTLVRGYHRIDAVARTEDYGSINSTAIHVYADGVGGFAEVAEEEVNAAVAAFEEDNSGIAAEESSV